MLEGTVISSKCGQIQAVDANDLQTLEIENKFIYLKSFFVQQ